MWELDFKECWAPKNWCFWTVVLEKTLESPLDCKEIQPLHPKGDQSWVFIGRTDVEAETVILWPPVVKIWLIWKDPDAGKDWGQEEKGTTEDEMVGWQHWLDGREFEQVGSWWWWWTGKPGALQSMGSQRVWQDWASELNQWLHNKTAQFKLCTKDYIITMYPAWGYVSPSWGPPVILKCKLWEWVLKNLYNLKTFFWFTV